MKEVGVQKFLEWADERRLGYVSSEAIYGAVQNKAHRVKETKWDMGLLKTQRGVRHSAPIDFKFNSLDTFENLPLYNSTIVVLLGKSVHLSISSSNGQGKYASY